MKNSTLSTLARYFDTITISSDNTELVQAVNELQNEYSKIAVEAQAKRDMYAQAKVAVMRALTDEPQTCAEIFNKCEASLPAGFSRNNLSYAFRNYWADDVNVTRDKVNMYTRK